MYLPVKCSVSVYAFIQGVFAASTPLFFSATFAIIALNPGSKFSKSSGFLPPEEVVVLPEEAVVCSCS
jgi:hypothetical protein